VSASWALERPKGLHDSVSATMPLESKNVPLRELRFMTKEPPRIFPDSLLQRDPRCVAGVIHLTLFQGRVFECH